MFTFEKPWVVFGGRTDEGYIVPPEGGHLQQWDYDGNYELWIGWTNYPAPYWNHWTWCKVVEEKLQGPYDVWWYGRWI